jgi:DNA polymerase-1
MSVVHGRIGGVAETASKKTADNRPRLLLMDGHSLAYRAFFALPAENFTTASGQTTNAVYGFASMLANTLRDEAPTHFAVAFDVSRKTWRQADFPEYKANRSKTPDEFKGQVELIGELLDTMNAHRFAVDGFEADDVIATLATQAEAAGFEVLIVTGDRDSFQLVSEHTTVLYPTKGVSELTRFTPAKVEEKYGLTPQQYPDFAALRGDPSDNLPGIPGVGEKTATKWINQFGSFAELVERAEEIKGKVGQSLRDHLESVKLNRHLTELVRDVELPKAVADLERAPYDRTALKGFLEVLEIRNPSLRERLLSVDPGAAEDEPPAPEAGVELDGSVLGAGEVAYWLEQHGKQPLGVATVAAWALGVGSVSLVRHDPARRVRRAGLRRLDLRPVPAEGHAQCQGRAAGLPRARLGDRRHHHGHGPRGLSGQARPPVLRAGRTVGRVSAPGAGPGRRGRAAGLRRRRAGRGRRADGTGPRGARPR